MPEILKNLGDAITGTDRDAAYREGLLERAELDNRRAQTDSAFALAKQRQIQAELEEQELEFLGQIAELDAAGLAGSPGMVTAAGRGSDYAGTQLGLNRYQEHGFREELADPMTDPMTREAVAGAMSPGAVVGLGDDLLDEPLEIVVNEDGSTSFVRRSEAVGRQPGSRPSTAAAPARTRQIDDLVARGMPEELAISLAYGRDDDPRTAHELVYRALLANYFYDEEEALQMANEYVELAFGAGATTRMSQPMLGDDLDADLGAPEYGSPDDVRDAMNAGAIDRETAIRILTEQFPEAL